MVGGPLIISIGRVLRGLYINAIYNYVVILSKASITFDTPSNDDSMSEQLLLKQSWFSERHDDRQTRADDNYLTAFIWYTG